MASKRARPLSFSLQQLPRDIINEILKFLNNEHGDVCRYFWSQLHQMPHPSMLQPGATMNVPELVHLFKISFTQQVPPRDDIARSDVIYEVIERLLTMMSRYPSLEPLRIAYSCHLVTKEYIDSLHFGQNSMIPHRNLPEHQATTNWNRWMDICRTTCGAQLFIAKTAAMPAELAALLVQFGTPSCAGPKIVVAGWKAPAVDGKEKIYLAICELLPVSFRLVAVVHSEVGSSSDALQWQCDYSMAAKGAYPKLCFELLTLLRKVAAKFCGIKLRCWQFTYVPLGQAVAPDTIEVVLGSIRGLKPRLFLRTRPQL
jgi:hypothetical protein